jgi:hypothetical protein
VKTTKELARVALMLAGTTFAAGAYAQTILKFSHTDQQQGARPRLRDRRDDRSGFVESSGRG